MELNEARVHERHHSRNELFENDFFLGIQVFNAFTPAMVNAGMLSNQRERAYLQIQERLSGGALD